MTQENKTLKGLRKDLVKVLNGMSKLIIKHEKKCEFIDVLKAKIDEQDKIMRDHEDRLTTLEKRSVQEEKPKEQESPVESEEEISNLLDL